MTMECQPSRHEVRSASLRRPYSGVLRSASGTNVKLFVPPAIGKNDELLPYAAHLHDVIGLSMWPRDASQVRRHADGPRQRHGFRRQCVFIHISCVLCV